MAYSNSKLDLTIFAPGNILDFHEEKKHFMAYSNSKLGLITLQKVVIGRLTDPLWYSSIPPNDERISTDQRFGFHCGHVDSFLFFQIVLWFFKSRAFE